MLGYLVMGFLVGIPVFLETAQRWPDPDFDEIVVGLICGLAAALVWPFTVIAFLLTRMFASRPWEPRSPILCGLCGGHDWHPIGGIPFDGKPGIWTDGTQELHCMKNCRARKRVWPWGDRVFESGERFGYRGPRVIR